MKALRILLVVPALVALGSRPASAAFHLMQVEQVIGGIHGLTSFQAVQLRMRATGENLMSNARLIAHDATGANPIILIAFPANVASAAAGSRVLAASAGFSTATIPALTPDFTFTNPIPDSYLAAGSLTYEDNFGTIYWRLSWGGAGYTGPGTGAITNDADGNFNPPFAGPFPSTSAQALQFQGAASAVSTNNANDYQLTSGPAIFTNNHGQTGTIDNTVSVGPGATRNAVVLEAPAPNPVRGTMSWAVVLPRDMTVEVRVVDLAGRAVRTLSDGTLSAGRHSFTWAAVGSWGPTLSSGLYFLQLNAEGIRATRRFVLLN
jgi:hypothetical protein